MASLEDTVEAYGRELGFDIVGITIVESFLRDKTVVTEGIRQGLIDGLPRYTEERVHKATHPELLLSEARSIVSPAVSGGRAKVARVREHDGVVIDEIELALTECK